MQAPETRVEPAAHNTDPWGDYLVRHALCPPLASRAAGPPSDDAGSSSWFVLSSGFFSHEDPEIHRLAQILWRIVAFNFAAALAFFAVFVVVVFATRPLPFALRRVQYAAGHVAADYVIFRASAKAIETRNRTLWCGVTPMGAFQGAYVTVAIVAAMGIFKHLVVQKARNSYTVLEASAGAAFVVLASVAAEYARRLRRVLPPTPEHLASGGGRATNKKADGPGVRRVSSSSSSSSSRPDEESKRASSSSSSKAEQSQHNATVIVEDEDVILEDIVMHHRPSDDSSSASSGSSRNLN